MGPMREKGVNSEECNLLNIQGYEKYNANYGDLNELFENIDDQGFVGGE